MAHSGIKVRLRELINREATYTEFEEYNKQVRGETNHRGAAILMAANTEIALEIALRRLMRRGRSDRMFGAEKPLGSFRNKIWTAYALGIIGNEAFDGLEMIREIRNAFAHAQVPITFETNEILDACAVLPLPDLRPPVAIPAKGIPSRDPRTFIGRERYEECNNRLGHNLHVLNLGGVLAINPEALGGALPSDYVEVTAQQQPLP